MKRFFTVLLSLMLCLSPMLPVKGDAAETALSLLAVNVRAALSAVADEVIPDRDAPFGRFVQFPGFH